MTALAVIGALLIGTLVGWAARSIRMHERVEEDEEPMQWKRTGGMVIW